MKVTHELCACLTQATPEKVHGEFTRTEFWKPGLDVEMKITHHSRMCSTGLPYGNPKSSVVKRTSK